MLLGGRSGMLLPACLHMAAAADGMSRFPCGIGGGDFMLAGNVVHRAACTGHDKAAVCRCGGRLRGRFRTGCPRLSLTRRVAGLLLGTSAVGKGVDCVDAAIIASAAGGFAAGLAAGLGLRLHTGFSCGSVLACGLHNARGHCPCHRIGQHTGERTPQRIAGNSGVQPDPRDDGVDLLGNLDHGKYHYDPRQYIQSAGIEWYQLLHQRYDDTANTMTICMTESGLSEINEAATVYTDSVKRGYSDCTMRITYAAALTADAEMGDTDNPNEVELTWRRTNSTHFDTLKDCCHVYTYGIDVLKQFSDNGGNVRNVKFRLHNDTDDCYIIAEQKDGVYYQVPTASGKGFPRMNITAPESMVKLSGVPSMVRRAAFATDPNNSNMPMLRCVNLRLTADGLRAVGSDGVCIVSAKGDKQCTGDQTFLIPAANLEKLAQLCEEKDAFSVGMADRQLVFVKECFQFAARLMHGSYVDTDSLIAGTQNTFTVLSDSEELRRTLQAATAACMDNRTILHFDGNRLTLRCTGEVGSSNAALTVIPLTGQPFGDYCFAVDRLERCLRALRGTVTQGIAQTGMLTLSTEDAFYMQTQLRMTASKAKAPRKKATKAA